MKDPRIHLQLIGIVFIILALVHIIFPKRFQWKDELSKLSLLNRQMMYVHTFFIALFVMLNGLLFVFYPNELVSNSSLSRALIFGLFIFWTVRGICQHFFYSTELWKGKRFETTIHILFSFLWLYVIIILGWILKSGYA